MAEREHPVIAPRPLFETLPHAVRAAIRHGNTIGDIKVNRWADTYRCGVEDVREAWERILSEESMKASDMYGEGK